MNPSKAGPLVMGGQPWKMTRSKQESTATIRLVNLVTKLDSVFMAFCSWVGLVRPHSDGRTPFLLILFDGQRPVAPAAPPRADARLKIEEVARQVRATLGAATALLVETGDSWFHGLETRLSEGRRFEIQFRAGSIGWSVPATLVAESPQRSASEPN